MHSRCKQQKRMQNTTVIITSKFAQEEGKSFESQKFWDAKVLRCKPFEQASPPTPWIWTHEHEHMYNSPSQDMHNGFNVRANQGRREKYEVAWIHTSGILLILFCILLQEWKCSRRSNSILQSYPKAVMVAQKHLALKLIKFGAWKIYDSIVHIWHLFGHYSGFIQASRFYRQQSRKTSKI